jgi:hypothetical protein
MTAIFGPRFLLTITWRVFLGDVGPVAQNGSSLSG